MRSHWASNEVKYCPFLPLRRVPRSLHGVSASNTTSLTNKGSDLPFTVQRVHQDRLTTARRERPRADLYDAPLAPHCGFRIAAIRAQGSIFKLVRGTVRRN
jgi:hypothetical protein